METIDVRLLTLDTIKNEKDAVLFALKKDDIKKAKQFAQADDQLRSYGSSYFKNVFLPNAPIQYGANGKPYVEGEHFSITHSGDYVAFAKANEEIGIDLEKIRKVNPRLKEYLKNAPLLKEEDLFHYWTLKEALAKCLGKGIDEDFKDLPCQEGKISYKNRFFFAKSIKMNDYYLAVCLETDEDFELNLSFERRIRTYR